MRVYLRLSRIPIACAVILAGFYILSIRQSWIAPLEFYTARVARALFERLDLNAEYGDVETIKPIATPPSTRFCPSDASIQFAKSAPPIWFDPTLKGGAHTWIFNGAEVVKALAAYCGDFRLNRELLMQIRTLLEPAKGPTATGGYQDQKQLGAGFMFLLVKRTPAIWDQLSNRERALIDLNMEALMYSSVFTTKDEVAKKLGMNGDTNLDRDWNPNYQNGMVGMVIVTALYWGFDEFEAKLTAYDDAEFLDKLRANNMKNLLSTYANPARAPRTTIQAGLRKLVDGSIYRFHGISERNLASLFEYIANRTFSAEITCGLNNGAGIEGFGRVAKNCKLLPNTGLKGMILEFASSDAEGRRSSAIYSWDAWYPLNYSRAALQITGWITPSTLKASSVLSNTIKNYWIGSYDLWFKMSTRFGGGYLDYSHGAPGELIVLDSKFNRDHGADANFDLFNLLQRHLNLTEIPFE